MNLTAVAIITATVAAASVMMAEFIATINANVATFAVTATMPIMEFGPAACAHAARVAIAPLEHASLVREMRAFRHAAYGQPLDA